MRSAPKRADATGPTENRTLDASPSHAPLDGHRRLRPATTSARPSIEALDALRVTSRPTRTMLDQLDQALGLVGGRDGAIGWIGDTAVVVNDAGGTPEGGLVIDPDRQRGGHAAVRRRCRRFVGLGGAQRASPSATRRTTGRRSRSSTSATPRELSGHGRRLTSTATCRCPTGHVEIAYAVTDEVVVIGTGPGLRQARPRHDRRRPRSRRSTPLQDARRRVGRRHRRRPSSTSPPSAACVEKAHVADGDPAERTEYETDVKPFLIPFDALFAAGSIGGDLDQVHVVITVK